MTETEESEPKRPRLSDEEYKLLKEKLKARKLAWKNLPDCKLIDLGLEASLNIPKEERIPILIGDVQSLMLRAVIGDGSSYQPFRWCKLASMQNLSQTVFIVVEDVSVNDFEESPHLFSESHKIFENAVEVANPFTDGISMDLSLAYIPISVTLRDKLSRVFKTLKEAADIGFVYGLSDLIPSDAKIEAVEGKENETSPNTVQLDSTTEQNSSLPEPNSQQSHAAVDEKCDGVKEDIKMEVSGTSTDQTSKVVEQEQMATKTGCSKGQLLLSPAQLIAEGYPLPGSTLINCKSKCKDFVFTHDSYLPVTNESPMFALDCEWCLCIDGSNGLARVALVDENLETVYHTYVKPNVPIVDYLTRFSGITKESLQGVKKTPTDVQNDLKKLIPPNGIIVGQSVNFDLETLKLHHPYIIDTSVIYNLTGMRSAKTKLSVLAEIFCQRRIQTGVLGHCPIEDAIASMELVLLKLNMGVEFGDVILSGGNKFHASLLKSLESEFKSAQTDACIRKKEWSSEEETFFGSSIHMKMFTLVHLNNKSAALITTKPKTDEIYRPKFPVAKFAKCELLSKRNQGEKLVPSVNIRVASHFHEAVNWVKSNNFNHNLTLLHTSLEDFAKKDAKNREEKLRSLDKAIAEIYGLQPINSFFGIVFGGTKNPLQNGTCLMKTKINKPTI